MKNQKKSKQFRQGDVLLVSVKKPTQKLVKTRKVTLALGEVTGHHHSVLDGGAVGYAEKETELAEFIEVKDAADLVHQEHNTITIPKGTYRSIIQSEYSPQEIRRVAD